MRRSTPERAATWLMALALVWLVPPGTTHAQLSTATIQGTVSDDTGVLPGASVTAREVQSGFTHEATTAEDGTFTLAGLRPGSYQITVAISQYKPEAKTVEVLVGQTVSLNFRITPDLVFAEAVTVVGDTRLIETRKSEVSTNVTQEQIKYLPQNSRNFLNFAALSPGVRVSDSEFNKQYSAGALASRSVNVFIDGVSYKNDVIEGGVVGQDSSRGNPFPQNAVQEFKVLTQNFKAEYEKAASAIITAVTKSGGNRYSGEVFNFYQDKNLVQNEAIVRNAQNLFVKGKTTPKPTYERWQWGASLGGPIVQNKMQFFGSYEENRQDRANQVLVGSVSTAPASLVQRLQGFEGRFTSPFRERLLFAKGSWQPKQGQQFEATYHLRHETDIRGFGGQAGSNSFQTAENVKQRIDSVQGKWQIVAAGFLNEAYVSYQRFRWNPVPENKDLAGENFDGLLRIGGRDTEQLFIQPRFSIRDDYTRFFKWHGSHTLKGGGVLAFADYDVTKRLNGVPLFTYRSIRGWDFPAEARYGSGDPHRVAGNKQVGLFAQDDWAIAPRLTLNMGLRWDYESDMINNDFVTPERMRLSIIDGNRYFSDGNNRPPFYGAWQPRFGLSYDVTGKSKTIAFAGWGRYYDRVIYNIAFDEGFSVQWETRTFFFSADGQPRLEGGILVPTLAWRPEYLSVQGLDGIIASGQAPNPNVRYIARDTKPPVSDQWNLGVRHTIGGIVTSVTYSGIRSRNLFTYIRGNRRPDDTCCVPVPGIGNDILISDPEGAKAWYDGLYVQAERPYGVGGAKWGLSFAYTLGDSTETGTFALDFPFSRVRDLPRAPTGNDERHRVVLTGIVGLPFDFIASTFITLGAGTPYTIDDRSLGGIGSPLRRIMRNAGRPDQYAFIFPDAWAFRSVDLQVERTFRFNGTNQVSVIFQGFNIFSYDNFSGYQGLIDTLPAVNLNFGRPSNLLDPGHRLQLGLRYGF